MKTINNVDDLSDDLCLYCPLDDGEKGTHGVPNGYISCEGKTNVPIPIDHAFNKVGDAYIDITFEFALHENPSIYEYVTFGEYDAKTIRKAALETGYYGEIYKWLYYQSKK